MYDPTKSKTTPLTADEVTPIADTLPEAVVEATLAVAEASPPPVVEGHHASLEHEHTLRIEDLRAHIASLTAQLEQQNHTIDRLLDMIK
jgi:hypothetical protein